MSRMVIASSVLAATLLGTALARIAMAQPVEAASPWTIELQEAVETTRRNLAAHLTAEQARQALNRQNFEIRYTLFKDCWQDWVVKSAALGEQESAALRQAVNQKAEWQAERHWTVVDAVTPRAFEHDFPVLFVQPKSLTLRFTRPAGMQSLLTPPQWERLQAPLKERLDQRAAAYRNYLISLLDAELFFSPDQRAALPRDLPPLDHPFLRTSTLASAYYPSLILPEVATPALVNHLSGSQRRRLEALLWEQAEPLRSLRLTSDESREEWDQRVSEYVQYRRQNVVARLELEVDDLERDQVLSPEQLGQLRTIAKGVAVSLCGEWHTNLLGRLDTIQNRRLARPRGGLTVSVISLVNESLDHPENHPHWAQALDPAAQAQMRDAEARRRNRQRADRDRAVLTMLDCELWLQPQQREQLAPLLSAALPPMDIITENREHYRDVIWLVHVFCLADVDAVQKVLTPPQWAAWQRMQLSVPVRQNIAPPTAALRLRENTLMSIPLMQASGQPYVTKEGQQLPGRPPVAPAEDAQPFF